MFLVANCVDFNANDYVLDMCAAPGGKTCFVASKLNQQGMMIANDINKLRAGILSENIERFGLKIAKLIMIIVIKICIFYIRMSC